MKIYKWMIPLLIVGLLSACGNTKIDPPTKVTVIDHAASFASLNWEYVDRKKLEIGNFLIRFSSDSGTSWSEPQEVSGTKLNSEVTDLEIGKRYVFQVAAQSGENLSDWSKSTASVLIADVPDQVPAPQVSKVSYTMASIYWDVPILNGDALTGFDVEHSSDNGATWVASLRKYPKETSQTISGLRPGTTYLVRVTAANGQGKGLPSNSISIKTKSPAQPVRSGDPVSKGDNWHFSYVADPFPIGDTTCADFENAESEMTYTLIDGTGSTIGLAESDSKPHFDSNSDECVAFYTIKDMPLLSTPVALVRTHVTRGTTLVLARYAPTSIKQGPSFSLYGFKNEPYNPALAQH